MEKIYNFKKLGICLLLMSLGFSAAVKAQVSAYGFTQPVGTYTPITGGTVLGSTTTDDQRFVDPASPAGGTTLTGVGFPIGFNFTYNGATFDRVGINANGWIALGQSALGATAVNLASTSAYQPISSAAAITPSQLRDRISAMGRDLQGQTGSEIRIETIGTAPNRVLVVQWTGFRKWNSAGDNLNFQIRLNETTNIVQIAYGTVVFNTTSNTAEVGLGGTSNADFNNRTSTTDWNATTAGTTNTATITMLNTVTPPVSGRTFTFTPPVPCTGTPTPGNTIAASNPACANVAFLLSLQNNPAVTGLTYQWQSSPDGVTYTNIAGATASTYSATQTTATYYRAIVTCSGNAANSTPVQVTMSSFINCYCPAGSTDVNPIFEKISNVTLGTLNNSSTSSAGYENFTALTPVASFAAGSVNPITITGSNTYSGDQVIVWIDFNHNGSFADAGETVYTSSLSAGPYTGTVTIPTSALLGNTRMRVRMVDASLGNGVNGPCGDNTYGQVEDYFINITPCIPVTVTSQPANATISCGGSTSFALGATGTGLTYQWEYRTSATGAWQNLTNGAPYSGVNTNTLTVSTAPGTLTGYQYRVVYTGACSGTDFSNVATLTVNPIVANVTQTPTGALCLGGIAKLSIANTTPPTIVSVASAPALNITIPDDGSTTGVNNTLALAGIPAGVTINYIRVKMNLTHSWDGDMVVALKGPNGQVLNLAYALTATGGTTSTTSFQPTFTSEAGFPYVSTGANPYAGVYRPDAFTPATGDPTVPTGPNGFIPANGNTTFNALYTPATTTTLNGNWTLAMYDYYADGTTTNKFNNWSIEVSYSGALANGVWTSPTPNSLYTDAAATVPYVTGSSVNTVYAKPASTGVTTYTVTVNNGLCTSATTNVAVTTNAPITGTSTVANQSVCAGKNITLSSTAPAGGFGIQHQWQMSTNGTTYTNVANGGVYSGATTGNLTITGATLALNGIRYRDSLYVTSCGSVLLSSAGVLTVNPNPTVTLTNGGYANIYPGLTTTLTTSVTPNAAATYTWLQNGVIVPGATTGTYVVDVDKLGSYSVRVIDINGCTGTSNTISIGDSANTVLFIYPSPSSGQFQVRYYSGTNNTQLPRALNVYDSKGSRVYSRTYTINAPYSGMDVDMSTFPSGIYTVELSDRNGNRIKTGRVVIR